jgi:hypothetical protein
VHETRALRRSTDTERGTLLNVMGEPGAVQGAARAAAPLVYALMFDMGGLPDDELFTTIERVGTEVIPAID